jgi:hypothetical protein
MADAWLQEGMRETDSDNLLEVKGAHLALVEIGAHPFFVDHCEAGASK